LRSDVPIVLSVFSLPSRSTTAIDIADITDNYIDISDIIDGDFVDGIVRTFATSDDNFDKFAKSRKSSVTTYS
jgi:hypothetical protein